MAIGPGKYDDVCTVARLTTHAKAVLVIVIDGIRGSGFSIQTEGLPQAQQLAKLLRSTADKIEEDLSADNSGVRGQV